MPVPSGVPVFRLGCRRAKWYLPAVLFLVKSPQNPCPPAHALRLRNNQSINQSIFLCTLGILQTATSVLYHRSGVCCAIFGSLRTKLLIFKVPGGTDCLPTLVFKAKYSADLFAQSGSPMPGMPGVGSVPLPSLSPQHPSLLQTVSQVHLTPYYVSFLPIVLNVGLSLHLTVGSLFC